MNSNPAQCPRGVIIAICIVNAVALSNLGAQAIWVGVLVQAGTLNASNTGWLAGLELLCSVCAAPYILMLGARCSTRTHSITASILLTAGNLCCVLTTLPALVMGRLLSGFSYGVLCSILMQVVTKQQQVKRLVATATWTTGCVFIAFNFLATQLASKFGVVAVFLLLSAMSIVALIASFYIPALRIEQRRLDGIQYPHHSSGSLLATSAMMMMTAGFAGLGTYVIVVAGHLAIDLRSAGLALTFAVPFGIAGPLVAATINERVGLARPIAMGLAVVMFVPLVLVRARSIAWFSIALAVQNFASGFMNPFFVALVTRNDQRGRYAAFLPALILLAIAGGASFGGELVGTGDVVNLGYFATFATLASITVMGYGLIRQRFDDRPSDAS